MSFSLTILGSSSATPTKTRHPSAQVLYIRNNYFLIDCGEGTQMQMKRFKTRFQRINHIFISHLHGDHYLGLPGLLFTMHLFGRIKPLHIYANQELEEIIKLQLRVSDTKLLYPLEFHHLQPGKHQTIFENNEVIVSAFPLIHRVPTHGFLFREKNIFRRVNKEAVTGLDIPFSYYEDLKKGKDIILNDGTAILNKDLTFPPLPEQTYAYCSDTGFDKKIIKYIENINLLYHEATFLKDREKNARDKMHSTAFDAATIAKEAKVKKLLIGHFSARYDDVKPLLDEAREVFAETYAVDDGQVYEL